MKAIELKGTNEVKTMWVRIHVPDPIPALRSAFKIGTYRVYFFGMADWGLSAETAVVDDFGNLVRVRS